MSFLNLHDFEPSSRANGPGLRSVIWVQGCTLNCPGCFNPATHDPASGSRVDVQQLAERIISQPDIEGLTISGGEPLQQVPALIELFSLIREKSDLSVLVFTGYTFDQVQKIPDAAKLLPLMDMLIAGPYHQSRRLATGLKGSANKTIHLLTSRYSINDLEEIPEAEITLSASGEIVLSGISPLTWGDETDG